jgi:hypothetical protein
MNTTDQVTQTLRTYNEKYGVDNKLTAQEKETLMVLLRKALAPSLAMMAADTEETATKAEALENISDKKLFEGGFAIELSEAFSEASMRIGFMFGEYMVRNNISEPTEETLFAFSAENNLPPIFFSKGVLIAHLHSLFVEDPLTLLMNYKQILQATPDAAMTSIMTAAAGYVATGGRLASKA